MNKLKKSLALIATLAIASTAFYACGDTTDPAGSTAEESKTEEPTTEEPKTEEPKTEEPKDETPKTGAAAGALAAIALVGGVAVAASRKRK